MQALGSAMIAIGIAKTQFDSLLATFGGGPGILIAGAALVAAGAAISAGASKSAASKSGYASGGSLTNTGAAAISSPLSSLQGGGGNNFTIGEVRLRGQDLIATLESGTRISNRKT